MSKKSSKTTPNEVSSYEERDIVLGKVRGYPPWPGMIVNPEKVPDNVTKERPGKKSNFYCVRFFPTGDFAWLVAKDISKLQKHEIESYINEPHKRSGELLQGYRIALDPTQWEEEISKAPYISQDNEGSEEVDQLADDGESSKKGSKKRKRESDAASKAKKAPKSKASSTEGSKKKGRKSSKSKETVESEDEADGDAEPEETDAAPTKKASPPPAKKAKRDKEGEGEELDLSGDKEAVKVREWRHKLQKAFLGKAPPEPSEAPVLDELFKSVETYEGMTIQYLQFSKIGKVMRHITVVGEDRLTRNAEFHFRERAKALVERWQSILGTSPSKPIGVNGAEGVTSLTAPPASAANGAADKMDVSPEVTEPNGVNGTKAPITEGISDADADAVGDTSLGDITMVES